MEDIVRSQLRVPLELHERLRLAAERTGRSMNAEILRRLTISFDGAVVLDLDAIAEKLAQPENRADLIELLSTIQRVYGKTQS